MALAAPPLDKRAETAPAPDTRPEDLPRDAGDDASPEPPEAAPENDGSLAPSEFDPRPDAPDPGIDVSKEVGRDPEFDIGPVEPAKPDAAERDTAEPEAPNADDEASRAETPGLPEMPVAKPETLGDGAAAGVEDGAALTESDTAVEEAPADGAPLLESLKKFGHVPVTGLIFESGGVELSASSAPALDDMARLLTENRDLRVAIVGHSDNTGPLDINITISRRRAETVRRALIERGVAADRLEARGVGYLAPRRSNATEEGRALNRRVELVLREVPDG